MVFNRQGQHCRASRRTATLFNNPFAARDDTADHERKADIAYLTGLQAVTIPLVSAVADEISKPNEAK